MVLPLLVALVSPWSPTPASLERPRPVPPAVQVWLSDRKTFPWGVRAKVFAETTKDGYLLVLHADAAGRVQVLFPLSPQGDQFVQARQAYELGDAGAAAVDDTVGHGIVFAAVASVPFTVDRYVRNGQWDLHALASESVQADPKGALLALLGGMQFGEGLRYDLASYAVSSERPARPVSRKYAERAAQQDPEPSVQPLAHQGEIYYPLAYGYSSGGWYHSTSGLNPGILVGALMSFPYRYDPFYRGRRKVWW